MLDLCTGDWYICATRSSPITRRRPSSGRVYAPRRRNERNDDNRIFSRRRFPSVGYVRFRRVVAIVNVPRPGTVAPDDPTRCARQSLRFKHEPTFGERYEKFDNDAPSSSVAAPLIIYSYSRPARRNGGQNV